MQNSELSVVSSSAALEPSHVAPAQNPVMAYYATLGENSERSAKSYLRKLAQILGYDEPELVPWEKLTYAHTQAIRKKLQDTYPPGTCNTVIAILKNLLKTTWRLGLINSDQYLRASDIPRVKGSRIPAGRNVSQQELAKIFQDCKTDKNITGTRDAAIFALLAGCGLRREEVANLKRENYNPETGELHVIGKGNKERTVFVTNGSKQALDNWRATMSTRSNDPHLIQTVTKGNTVTGKMTGAAIWLVIKKRCQNVNIPKFTPHDLRRTFVTNLLQNGVDIKTVADMAGHANITTTAIYDRRNIDTQKNVAHSVHIPY